jgi:hypothetical protein
MNAIEGPFRWSGNSSLLQVELMSYASQKNVSFYHLLESFQPKFDQYTIYTLKLHNNYINLKGTNLRY